MFQKTLLPVCCLLFITSAALGHIDVRTNNEVNCSISHYQNTITINEPGTFGFRAYDPNDPNNLEDINSLTG